MKSIKNWQTQTREYFLQKMIKKIDLKRRTVTFESAQTIGIMFDATELNHKEVVMQFSKKLREKNKKVKLLGFFNNKHDVNSYSFKAFNRNEVDWLMRPKSEAVENFNKSTFDLLIGIYEGENLLKLMKLINFADFSRNLDFTFAFLIRCGPDHISLLTL